MMSISLNNSNGLFLLGFLFGLYIIKVLIFSYLFSINQELHTKRSLSVARLL